MKKSNFFSGAAIGAAIAGLFDWLFFRRQWGAEADTLRSELNISRRQQQDLQKRMLSGSADSTEIQGKLTAAEARTSELESMMAKLEADNKALKSKLNKSKVAQAKKLSAANVEIKSLQAQLADAQAQATSASNGAGSISSAVFSTIEAQVVDGEFDQVIEEVIGVDDSAESQGGISDTKPVSNDDLRLIEGIGPKISKTLYERGVTSFAQMAAMSPDEIKAILKSAGIGRVNDPTTWPEQAGIAAKGEWEALKSLQDSLKGGRRA